MAYVYILKCSDGSYYTGKTQRSLEERLDEHMSGNIEGYTSKRLPVELVFCEEFERIVDAIQAERQIKGWSRAKKEALMNGDFKLISKLARRTSQQNKP